MSLAASLPISRMAPPVALSTTLPWAASTSARSMLPPRVVTAERTRVVGSAVVKSAVSVETWPGQAAATAAIRALFATECEVFLVFNGTLHTTPVSAALLNGITRHTLMTLAQDVGIKVVERDLPREYLYLADEVFMCGTAAEVTPIRSVDGKQIGEGKAGPLTRRMQELYFGLFTGRTPDKYGWLEPA